MLFIRRCESWQDFLVSFFGQGEELLVLFRQLFLFETQLFVSPAEDAYLAAVINEQGRQHQMGSPYDAEALASAARRVSQKDSGNLKSLNIRNGRGDAMWSLMYVFHDHIIPRATQLIVKKHDFADKRRVLSETLAFSKNPFSNTGFLWDEHRLSTGKYGFHKKYILYMKRHSFWFKTTNKTMFPSNTYKQMCLNFPRYHNFMWKDPIFRHLRSHSYSSM